MIAYMRSLKEAVGIFPCLFPVSFSDWFSDVTIVQCFILYVFYLFTVSKNTYYMLSYTFVQMALFGFFLAIIQMEIFTAFLWLTELVVLLVFLFLILNTDPSGSNSNKDTFNQNKKVLLILFLILVSFLNCYFIFSESQSVSLFLTSILWDDYYEAINNINMNDLYGVYISFYILNALETILIGFVLLFASMIAVNLNSLLKKNKSVNYVSFSYLYDYFKYINSIIFMRKQNLVNQENSKESTRSFKKKK